MIGHLSDTEFSTLSNFVADRLGLHFPDERRNELEHGLRAAAAELGVRNDEGWINRLLGVSLQKEQVEILAKHLTVGETYFFREQPVFRMLEEQILPAFIQSRREDGRRLRIWSAGCCTGEEPYSLAILLHKLIPDLRQWNILLLATDINPHFLRKASSGLYTEWSFRETPSWVKDRYFQRIRSGQYEISPMIRKLVSFSYLNLAESCYPSLLTNTNAMDMVFCRNVLMYFAPNQTRMVVRNLHDALLDGGWFFIGQSESSQLISSHFTPVHANGATVYKKESRRSQQREASWVRTVQDQIVLPLEETGHTIEQPPIVPDSMETHSLLPEPGPIETPAVVHEPFVEAQKLFERRQYSEAREILLAIVGNEPNNARALALLARIDANIGRLDEAVDVGQKAVENDKLNPLCHYLLASIFWERGNVSHATSSLYKTLYLDPNFVLAHVALGTIARRQGKAKESEKWFGNALLLLSGSDPGTVLPEADGITVGSLQEIIRSTTSAGVGE